MANSGTDIGRAFVQIIPSAEGISGNVKKALDPVADEAGESFGKKLFGKLKTLAGAMALGKIIGDSLNEGGQLQQSIGGVETLFKKSASTVIANADKAFQTVGMSANEYMQNVTSFSASLLQSLGGDTAKAAKIADMAMVDMSDNANKMGTSLDSITTAYQGFAKQNYTMLDNLKLGYGGTKKEMERLLKDAQKITGVKYNIENLNDVYEAIHVIQGELGITGTTAKEASETLEGSANAMKAAWKNMLGAMATGGDIQTALNNVIDTFMTWAFGNLLPMIGQVIGSLPSIAMGLVDGIIEHLPEVMQTGVQLLGSLAEGVSAGIPQLLSQALPTLANFTETLRQNFGQIVDAGIDVLLSFVDGIVEAMPDLIAYVPTIITNIAGIINDNMPKVIMAGFQIIAKLIVGIWNNIPNLLANFGNIVEAIWSVITAVNWLDLGSKIVKGIINGVKALFTNFKGTFDSLSQKALEAIASFDWKATGKRIIDGIVAGIKNFGGNIFGALKDKVGGAFDKLKGFLQIGSPSKLFRDEIGKWIPLGIADGIAAGANAITEAMDDVANLITDPSVQMAVTQSAPAFENVAARPALTVSPTINNYNSGDLDEEAVAQRTVDLIVEQIQKEEFVWA